MVATAKCNKTRSKQHQISHSGRFTGLVLRSRRRSPLPAALLACGAATVLSLPPAVAADGSKSIRRDRAAAAGRAHGVLLELYALDSRLDANRARVASLDAAAARLARERAELGRRLRIAERTLARAQRAAANELRVLYEQSPPDALAVLLGASTLQDGLDRVDELKRATSASESVVAQSGAARTDVLRLRRELTARERNLHSVRLGLAAEGEALGRARADRAGFLEQLQLRVRADNRQLAALEARARAAEAKARAATARAAVEPSVTSLVARAPLAVDPPPPAAAAPHRGPRTIVIVSTGYSLPGTTATGLPVGHGIAAVDPTVIPLGTRMTIPGYGEAVAADTGSAIRGIRVDLWFPTQREAEAWGWQTLTVTLH